MDPLTTKLATRQRKRLDYIADEVVPEPKVIGWSYDDRGPILRFSQGWCYVITRNGGMFHYDETTGVAREVNATSRV